MSDDDKYGYRIDPSGLNNCDRKSGPPPEEWDEGAVDLTKPQQLDVTANFAPDPRHPHLGPGALESLARFGHEHVPDEDVLAAQKHQAEAFSRLVRRKREEAGLRPIYHAEPPPARPPDDYSTRAADAKQRLFENETGAYWLELMMAAPLPKKGNDE